MGWWMFILVLLFAVSETNGGLETRLEWSNNVTTNGESGVKCSRIGRKCLAEAECVKKNCQCKPPLKGNGLIECVNPDEYLCMLTGDPHLISFGGAIVDVSIPCRFRMARFTTPYINAFTSYSHCAVEVFAINVPHRDQYYVNHVEVSIGVTDSGQQIHQQYEIRKYGTGDDEIYQYLSNVSSVKSVWGHSKYEEIKGVKIIPTYDHINNFGVLSLLNCGARIKYRAYDKRLRRQVLLPGITIMQPHDAKTVTGYGDYYHSVCGTMNDTRNLFKDRAAHLGVKSPSLAILHDILLERLPQLDHSHAGQCEKVMTIYQWSQRKVEDINECGPIMTRHNARKCIHRQGLDPLDLLTSCLLYRQNNSKEDCMKLLSAANICGMDWAGPKILTC